MSDKTPVLITSSTVAESPEDARAVLEAAGIQPVFRRSTPDWSVDQILDALGDVTAVIAGTEHYGEEVFSRAPKLKVVSRTGVGYDAVDVAAATRHGVAVMTTPGANDRTVADYAMTLILALARKLFEADRAVRSGRWVRPEAMDLRDKVVGIVGTGAIGKHVARRAHGFECRILAYDVVHDQDFAERYGVSYLPLDTLLAQSDFVTIHAPLMPQTRQMIGEPQLRAMKETAYLVNTARGPLVDEAALNRALREGWIAGAGLDVFENEPPWGSPLLELDNVILSAHCAGISVESRRAMGRIACQNVVAVLNGQPPVYCVNPEVLSTR
jgi:D-3-phosphoglycerate dehydrogenase / 2-oxoglutarate reductase